MFFSQPVVLLYPGVGRADKVVGCERESDGFEFSHYRPKSLLGGPLLADARFLKNDVHCYLVN